MCGGDEIVINDVTYNVQGSFTQLFTNTVGCDSTLVLNIIVDDSCVDCEDFTNGHKMSLKLSKGELITTINIKIDNKEINLSDVKNENVESVLLHFVSLKSGGVNLVQLNKYSLENLNNFSVDSFLKLESSGENKLSTRSTTFRNNLLEDFLKLRHGVVMKVE